MAAAAAQKPAASAVAVPVSATALDSVVAVVVVFDVADFVVAAELQLAALGSEQPLAPVLEPGRRRRLAAVAAAVAVAVAAISPSEVAAAALAAVAPEARFASHRHLSPQQFVLLMAGAGLQHSECLAAWQLQLLRRVPPRP